MSTNRIGKYGMGAAENWGLGSVTNSGQLNAIGEVRGADRLQGADSIKKELTELQQNHIKFIKEYTSNLRLVLNILPLVKGIQCYNSLADLEMRMIELVTVYGNEGK